MTPFVLLIPFVLAVAVSVVSRKACYGIIIGSSVLLAGYALGGAVPGTLAFFFVLSSLVLAVSSWYAIGFDRGAGRWLAPLFATAAFGIALVLLSQNYLEFLAGWEIMSVAGYLMIGLHKKDPRPAFLFVAFSEVSTVFLIAGMAVACTLTGSFSFVSLPDTIPLTLMAIGFFIKMGVLPFIIGDWLPVADGSSPAPVAAVLSALVTLIGVFGLIRIVLISPSSMLLGAVLIAIGTFTVLFAALYAYVSENTRLFLGYSTVENNGAILVGIGLLIASPPGMATGFLLSTVLMLCLAHSTAKTGLFLLTGSLDSDDLDTVQNRKDIRAIAGTALLSASLSGLLPTIGGVAVWMLLEALFMTASVSAVWITVPAILAGSLLALGEGIVSGAMIKFISFTLLFDKSGAKRPENIFPVLLAGALVIVLGVGSILLINPDFVTGNPAVGIPAGLLISSLTGAGTTFGVVSPVFIALLTGIFALGAFFVFGKPVVRRAAVWNNGIEPVSRYTSFGFANNIRLMMGKIVRTDLCADTKAHVTRNIFWEVVTGGAGIYKNAARKITWYTMNSSMGSYICYLVVAFIFAMVFVVVTGVSS